MCQIFIQNLTPLIRHAGSWSSGRGLCAHPSWRHPLSQGPIDSTIKHVCKSQQLIPFQTGGTQLAAGRMGGEEKQCNQEKERPPAAAALLLLIRGWFEWVCACTRVCLVFRQQPISRQKLQVSKNHHEYSAPVWHNQAAVLTAADWVRLQIVRLDRSLDLKSSEVKGLNTERASLALNR